MSKSSVVRGTTTGESIAVCVDGYGVDYSHCEPDDPNRTAAIVSMWLEQRRKIGVSPEKKHSMMVTLTPETAEELAHALIVHAAHARADRDAIVLPTVRMVP